MQNLGWPWILVHLTELCSCRWTCKWIICAAAKSGFVLQHRLRHKSTLCIPRMTRHSRSSGVWKGIRQTEFCHYFPTRVFSLFSDREEFAGTEGLDVLWLTQDADLVRTAWDEHQPIGSSNPSGQHLLLYIRGHLFHNSQEDKGNEKWGWNAQKRCGKLIFFYLFQQYFYGAHYNQLREALKTWQNLG